MKDLIIKLKDVEHAKALVDFAAKYPKADSPKPTTKDERYIADWLDEMKTLGGWYKISVTTERMKLIFDASALN